MFPENTGHRPAEQAVPIHQPTPIAPYPAAPVIPVQPAGVPSVTSIVLPDGRVITGYAIDHIQPAPVTAKPVVSRAAVNIALGGIGFGAVCGGLVLLATFIAALAALVQQLIILTAVIFGGFIALQVLSAGRERGATTVNIRKAVIKRNHFHG
ncbi:hypothetical protein [Streptomyces microflavus]|uniref:hypothetical protein n=1 Tax=Streptomyces microflavus TaxID=1919 RepID=UPI00386FF0E1|nr:hypothetical protein OH770_27695 [Streptomyces microflavus]